MYIQGLFNAAFGVLVIFIASFRKNNFVICFEFHLFSFSAYANY